MKNPQKNIRLDDASFDQLPMFAKMEADSDTAKFVTGYSLARHQEEFRKPTVIYKSIMTEHEELVGFVILAKDEDPDAIEFRRIVVSNKGKGIGRAAVRQIDRICTEELDISRIWLDVFEINDRAKNLYESCGYKEFSEADPKSGRLLIYQKVPNKASEATACSRASS